MTDSPEDTNHEPQLSLTIGAVSRATGIPVNTIRTWERRYKFPTPNRSKGGQRLYNPRVVPRLRLVARALELGHRPRQVVGLSFDQLRQLVGALPDAAPEPAAPSDLTSDWLQAARRLDGETLERGFQRECSQLGLEGFLRERVSPFLKILGESWAAGELEISHEHFASERVQHFLANQWRPLSDRARGPYVICAGLPDEQHVLGLHMVAAMLAVNEYQVLFLGANTPLESIQGAIAQTRAVAVMISVSPSAEPEGTLKDLVALRELLDPSVEILVGGAGAPGDIAGIQRYTRLNQVADWARSRQPRR